MRVRKRLQALQRLGGVVAHERQIGTSRLRDIAGDVSIHLARRRTCGEVAAALDRADHAAVSARRPPRRVSLPAASALAWYRARWKIGTMRPAVGCPSPRSASAAAQTAGLPDCDPASGPAPSRE